MKIVNKSLPTGNKFIPIADATLKTKLKTFLSRPNMELILKSYDLIKSISSNSEYWGMTHCLQSVEITEGTDEYPIIKVPTWVLGTIDQSLYASTSTAKAMYGGPFFLFGFGTCILERNKVTLRWDPTREGVIMYDVPYQGDLISNKPMVINRQLKEYVKTYVNTLAVEALLDSSGKGLQVARVYQKPSERAEVIASVIPKLIEGNYTSEELAQFAYSAQMYPGEYQSRGGYVLNLSVQLNADIKLNPATRTKLIYLFGGYQLPEDYMNWFDG